MVGTKTAVLFAPCSDLAGVSMERYSTELGQALAVRGRENGWLIQTSGLNGTEHLQRYPGESENNSARR